MTKNNKWPAVVAFGGALAALGWINARVVQADGVTGALITAPDGPRATIARGATQTWTWTVPRGYYAATARMNYRLYARGGGSTANDSRIQCSFHGDQLGAGDFYNDGLSTPQVSPAGPLFGDGSRDGFVTLEASIGGTYGDLHVSLDCTNVSVSPTATPIMIDRVTLRLIPVASFASSPAPTMTTRTPTATPPPPPPPMTIDGGAYTPKK